MSKRPKRNPQKKSISKKVKIYSKTKKNKIYMHKKKNIKSKSIIKKGISKRILKPQRQKITLLRKKKILLPKELLKIAKNISVDNTISNLSKAISKYDINDEINFNYLMKCGKIDKENYKYIYTLSYDNRQKIIEKYKLRKQMLTKRARIIFQEFVNFLITKYKSDNKSSEKDLNYYKLEHFEKFIIQINEGTEELKYYYFIYIIFGWLEANKKKAIECLEYFEKFFKYNKNIYQIKKVFYVLFRIDLFFLSSDDADEIKLINMYLMIDEDTVHKTKILNNIRNEIEEEVNKIGKKTILTLKENQYKFRPFDYYFFDETKKNRIIKSIKEKKLMSFDYCLKNKYNYFDNEEKKNAFFNIFRKILSSSVMEEFYDKLKSSEKYEFPFYNKKIINFLWKKLIYTEVDDDYCGLTNKEGFGIYINRKKGNRINGLGYGLSIITISHEFVTHNLTNLINSNNGDITGTFIPIKNFIETKDNNLTDNLKDSRDKFETLLFGQKVSMLTVGGNHFLFNLNNWDLSLPEFKKRFQNNNVIKKVAVLKKEFRDLMESDNDVKQLFLNVNYDHITDNIQEQSIVTRTKELRISDKEFIA